MELHDADDPRPPQRIGWSCQQRRDVLKPTVPAQLFSLLVWLALSLVVAPKAFSQEGYHDDQAHSQWHEYFYNHLMRNDTKTSCCSMNDCVPTQSRMTPQGHEVKIEGKWTRVPPDTVLKVSPPDGGAHVCFTKSPIQILCVVLPPET